MISSMIVRIGVVAAGTLTASFLAVSTAQAHGGQSEPSHRNPGMQRMHELHMQGNPGMQRMHELHMQGNPGMQRMHELHMQGNPGMQRMHELHMQDRDGMHSMDMDMHRHGR